MGTEEPDKRVGRQSTRVHDFVNRGVAFDSLYQFAPFLAAYYKRSASRSS